MCTHRDVEERHISSLNFKAARRMDKSSVDGVLGYKGVESILLCLYKPCRGLAEGLTEMF